MLPVRCATRAGKAEIERNRSFGTARYLSDDYLGPESIEITWHRFFVTGVTLSYHDQFFCFRRPAP